MKKRLLTLNILQAMNLSVYIASQRNVYININVENELVVTVTFDARGKRFSF